MNAKRCNPREAETKSILSKLVEYANEGAKFDPMVLIFSIKIDELLITINNFDI